MYIPPNLNSIEGMDIYLLDQIMKGRYIPGQCILDAGAGGGRNLNWFFSERFEVTACDIEAERQALITARYPGADFQWETTDLAALPFADGSFDHVICNAVLHFARDEHHFESMWLELVRVLKKKGSILIRTSSDIGMEQAVMAIGHGRYQLPDGSERFLANRDLIHELMNRCKLDFLEPLKSVNVEDLRVMSTLVMVKGG